MDYALCKHVGEMNQFDVAPFIPKWKQRKRATWHNYDGVSGNKQASFLIQQNYRYCVIRIANSKIANPRQHAKRRIIIATIQLKLRHNCHNKQNDRITYNLAYARRSGEILPDREISTIQKTGTLTCQKTTYQNTG